MIDLLEGFGCVLLTFDCAFVEPQPVILIYVILLCPGNRI